MIHFDLIKNKFGVYMCLYCGNLVNPDDNLVKQSDIDGLGPKYYCAKHTKCAKSRIKTAELKLVDELNNIRSLIKKIEAE